MDQSSATKLVLGDLKKKAGFRISKRKYHRMFTDASSKF
jgi:hypothetical protein